MVDLDNIETWITSNIIPNPNTKPPSYADLTRDNKDSLMFPTHYTPSQYNSLPVREISTQSSRDVVASREHHKQSDPNLQNSETLFNSYPAYKSKSEYSMPWASHCNMDINNNYLTRTPLDHRYSNVYANHHFSKVSHRYVVSVEKSDSKKDGNAFYNVGDDRYVEHQVRDTIDDEPTGVFDYFTSSFNNVTSKIIPNLVPSHEVMVSSVKVSADLCKEPGCKVAYVNKGQNLCVVDANSSQANVILSQQVADNVTCHARLLGMDRVGYQVGALGVDANVNGWALSATVQSRPSFLPLIHTPYYTANDTSTPPSKLGSISLLKKSNKIQPSSGTVGPINAKHPAPRNVSLSRNSTGNATGNATATPAPIVRSHLSPAQLGDTVLGGVNLLGAGFGNESEYNVHTDISTPISLDLSPSTLNDSERKLIDTPVFHLSAVREVEPLFTDHPYTHAYLGCNYAVSKYYFHWQMLKDQYKADSIQLTPGLEHMLSSFNATFKQTNQKYNVAFELLDFAKHLRLSADYHFLPEMPPPASSITDSIKNKFSSETQENSPYPNVSVSIGTTSSLRDIADQHKVEYNRHHVITSRSETEKQRQSTIHYLSATGETDANLPLATIPSPPSMSCLTTSYYSSFLKACVANTFRTHHLQTMVTYRPNPSTTVAVGLDSNLNLKLHGEYRNSKCEAPMQRNSINSTRLPNNVDGSQSFKTTFGLHTNIFNPTVNNTGIVIGVSNGDL